MRLLATTCADERSLSAFTAASGGDVPAVLCCCPTLSTSDFSSAADCAREDVEGGVDAGEDSTVSGTPMITPKGFGSRCDDRHNKSAASAARIATDAANAKAGAVRFLGGGKVGMAAGAKLRVKAV